MNAIGLKMTKVNVLACVHEYVCARICAYMYAWVLACMRVRVLDHTCAHLHVRECVLVLHIGEQIGSWPIYDCVVWNTVWKSLMILMMFITSTASQSRFDEIGMFQKLSLQKAMFCDHLINTLSSDDTETCLLIYAVLICHLLEAKCQCNRC